MKYLKLFIPEIYKLLLRTIGIQDQLWRRRTRKKKDRGIVDCDHLCLKQNTSDLCVEHIKFPFYTSFIERANVLVIKVVAVTVTNNPAVIGWKMPPTPVITDPNSWNL